MAGEINRKDGDKSYTNMNSKKFEKLINRPLSAKDVIDILKSDYFTLRLISEYNFFNDDQNTSLYKKYISGKIRKRESLYNAFEMARLIEDYSDSIVRCISFVFISSKNIMLKLSCLDYLINMYKEFDKGKYIELSELVHSHTGSSLVKFQSSINLVYANADADNNIRQISEALTNQKDGAFYYRLTEAISDLNFKNSIAKKLIGVIKNRLSNNKEINEKQKKDISAFLSKIEQGSRQGNVSK